MPKDTQLFISDFKYACTNQLQTVIEYKWPIMKDERSFAVRELIEGSLHVHHSYF